MLRTCVQSKTVVCSIAVIGGKKTLVEIETLIIYLNRFSGHKIILLLLCSIYILSSPTRNFFFLTVFSRVFRLKYAKIIIGGLSYILGDQRCILYNVLLAYISVCKSVHGSIRTEIFPRFYCVNSIFFNFLLRV